MKGTRWLMPFCLLGVVACGSGAKAFVGCYEFDWTAFDDPRLIAPDLVPDGVRLIDRASDEPGWRIAEPKAVVNAAERWGAIAFWYDVLYQRRWKKDGDRVIVTLADYGFTTWTITLTPDGSDFQGEASYVSTMGGGRRESTGTLTARRCDDGAVAPG